MPKSLQVSKPITINGKFDCIYVAPCVQDVECIDRLKAMLNENGRLVVPLLDEQAQGQKLLCIDRVDASPVYSEEKVMSVLCQPILKSDDIAAMETKEEAQKAERAKRRTKAEIQQELKEWVEGYEQTYGRKPNREEMMEDPVGSSLFKEFSAAKG